MESTSATESADAAFEAVIDHIALSCPDPLALAKWYHAVFGFEAIDFDEFLAKKRPFPSVRISNSTIIDFFPASGLLEGCGAGQTLNHFCLALKNRGELERAVARLEASGFGPADATPKSRSGARGQGWSVYANDLAGNTLELRYYD